MFAVSTTYKLLVILAKLAIKLSIFALPANKFPTILALSAINPLASSVVLAIVIALGVIDTFPILILPIIIMKPNLKKKK